MCASTRGFSIQCQIKPPAATVATERPPLHVAVVLDKSGSMQVEHRLRNCKRAVRKLIKHLEPECDRLHFVTYDSEAITVFADGDLNDKEALDAHVREVKVGTCTNLHAGLQRGFELLQVHKTPRDKNKPTPIQRIFLFSDGLVNEGVRNVGILRAVDHYVTQDVQVSSFGIGSDFDLALMTNIAEHGKGDYFYLKPDDITKLVSKSIHRLMSVAGTEVRLTARGLNGFFVKSFTGHPDPASLLHGIQLGDMHHGSEKRVLLTLEGAASEATAADFPALEVWLRYTNAADQPPVPGQSEEPAEAPPRIARDVRAQLCLGAVEDASSLAPANPLVVAVSAILRSVDLDDQVEELLVTGNHAKAIATKQESVALLQAAVDSFPVGATTAPAPGPTAPAEATPGPTPPVEGRVREELRSGEPKVSDAARLVRLLEKARATLEAMRTSRDTEGLQREMAHQSRMTRAMSDDELMASGCDSDSWGSDGSDGGGGGGGLFALSPPGRAPRFQSDDSGSDTDTDDWREGRGGHSFLLPALLGVAATEGRALSVQSFGSEGSGSVDVDDGTEADEDSEDEA